ncbi:MAG: cyclase family protein [Solirubrobacterales bacterium]|jgi:kynurenine formamidase|nr:cyclase family protein [Solirubrobacterales bacterium]
MNDWAGRFHDLSSSIPAVGRMRAYDLAVPLVPGMSRHPAHPPYSFVLTKRHGDHPYPGGISAISELISMGAHVGTHIDALGHIAYCGEIHGGHAIDGAHTHTGGLEIGSTEEIPPLLGPGHLLDAVALFGRELTPADGIGPDELSAWFSEHREPGPGSTVLIRTGWMRFWDDVNSYIGLETGLPGLTRDGAEWLSERGIVAAGSDTMNLEHKPAGVVSLQVHVHFLFERGIYIMESMNLEVLAADGVTDFTFFATPLRIRGGTGSPLRPLAVIDRAGA